MAATAGSIFTSSTQLFSGTRSVSCGNASSASFSSTLGASSFTGTSLRKSSPKKKKVVKISGKVSAKATIATTTSYEKIKEYARPSWAMFELGRAPVYWKTMNGLPPMAGEMMKLFYNPTATKLVPNEEFRIDFNGNFYTKSLAR